jgi:DNA-binding IclR family transcriptional regulator
MTENDKDNHSSYSLRTLHRGIQVLKAFSFEQPSWSLAELAPHLGWNRATVHRILLTLREAGMLEMDPETNKYHLGIGVFELGGVMLSRLGLTAKAYPFMARLTDTTGLACNLGILDGRDVVYIDRIEAGTHLQLSARPGWRLPSYRTAMGRAILAELPNEQVRTVLEAAELVRTTPFTINTIEGIQEQLELARQHGYSKDMEENTVGIAGLGAAIFDHRGCAFAGLSIGGPVSLFSSARIEELGASLRSAALQVSQACGANILELSKYRPEPPRADTRKRGKAN